MHPAEPTRAARGVEGRDNPPTRLTDPVGRRPLPAGPRGPGEATPRADAVLLIHVTDPPVASGVAAWWRQLRAHYLHAAAPAHPPTLELLVQDRQGRCVGHLHTAAAVNRLVLPGGPYLVTARQGAARRGYYLSLAPGRESQLFVDLRAG